MDFATVFQMDLTRSLLISVCGAGFGFPEPAKILYPLLITSLRYIKSKTREKQPTVLLVLLKCAGRPET